MKIESWFTRRRAIGAAALLGVAAVALAACLFGRRSGAAVTRNDAAREDAEVAGFSGDELREALISNGVHVLEDECALVDDSFYVAGRLDSGYDRISAADLLEGLDTGKYIIMLDHEPNDYDNEAATAADLVLSGHTHGGQLIPITFVGVAFGINDSTYGYERINGTDFIVTSGISDWALYFKTGTHSEYVIIDILPE